MNISSSGYNTSMTYRKNKEHLMIIKDDFKLHNMEIIYRIKILNPSVIQVDAEVDIRFYSLIRAYFPNIIIAKTLLVTGEESLLKASLISEFVDVIILESTQNDEELLRKIKESINIPVTISDHLFDTLMISSIDN